MNELSRLKPPAGAVRRRKRVGRGIGSGNGKTAGRGQKGQKSRTGAGVRPGFEGGQMPMYRRLPKRGFHNPFKSDWQVVNVAALEAFEPGAVVDRDALIAAGLIRARRGPVVLLGKGELTHAVTVRVDRVSAGARKKVEGAGGTVEVAGG